MVTLLLAAGELAQGLADRAHAERGGDGPDAAADAAMDVALSLGRIVWRSHRSGWRELEPIAGAQAALDRLAALPLPEAVTARSAEGFEHYALYPEAYADAAAALAADVDSEPLIIGIRTIGCVLAAMVAAGCGARNHPMTVRPVGHPFQRTLALRADASEMLRRQRDRTVAVVDEGPGLSGSSFAAVLGALRDAGVPPANVRVFPSHLSQAPLASDSTRGLWDAVTKHCRPFEAIFSAGGPRGLARWTEELTGRQTAPPEDIAGGRWRALRFADTATPPAHVSQERRKYLLRTNEGAFLAKFAGLGPAGERRLARARRLGEEGVCPRPLGLRNGFLVERWHEDARPLAGAGARVARSRVVADVGRYVALRARLRAAPDRGAGPGDLLRMATTNAVEELGDRGRALETFADSVDDLARATRPVE